MPVVGLDEREQLHCGFARPPSSLACHRMPRPRPGHFDSPVASAASTPAAIPASIESGLACRRRLEIDPRRPGLGEGLDRGALAMLLGYYTEMLRAAVTSSSEMLRGAATQ